ncbi:winged helix-turn-helix transcriptional regulator [Micromonospora chokoriensis]
MNTRRYDCGVDAALDVINGKWKTLIIMVLAEESRRFGELKRLVPGISDKVLTQHLRDLEARFIVRREVLHDSRVKVKYSLTSVGTSLNDALGPLCEWGERLADTDQ